MGKSKLIACMSWGTLKIVLALVLVFSSCSLRINKAQETKDDFINQDCISAASSSHIIQGQKIGISNPDNRNAVLLISDVVRFDEKTKTYKKQQAHCTATPISSNVLLTAAHCVKSAVKISASFYPTITCSSGYSFTNHTIVARDFTYHPLYDDSEDLNNTWDENPDLALIRLDQNIPSQYPIFKIANVSEISASDLYLYGFGKTGTFDKGEIPYLRRAVVDRRNLGLSGNNLIIDQQNKPGVCNGDSGGAGLMQHNNELVIIGVNSFVYNTKNTMDSCNGSSSLVLAYSYINWINETMQKWGSRLKK
ncbi:MAG: trypsin-like serine protease [Pseudobdellovibrio sp.]